MSRMSDADLLFLLSLSVIVPVTVGLVRSRKISVSYQPFLLYLNISLLAECITYLFIKMFKNSAIPNNVFMLVECNVLLFQFYYWRINKDRKKFFLTLIALCSSVWIIENILFAKVTVFGPVFRFLYSFILVLLALNEINFMIVRENKNLFKNSKFLICLGFMIYFLYQILYEGSFFVNVILMNSDTIAGRETRSQSKGINFSKSIITSFAYIAAFIKIVYAIAIFYIPARTKFPWKLNLVK
ncbi:MAG: hypothetical protein WKF97_09860 [Chitinophagaceae bacterium]